MYSIDIEGLSSYRTQTGENIEGEEERISEQAAGMAKMRIYELRDVYEINGSLSSTSDSYSLNEEGMRNAINNWSVSTGYMDAVATESEQATWTEADYRNQLLEDYQTTLDTSMKSWNPTGSPRSNPTTRRPPPGPIGQRSWKATPSNSSSMRDISPPNIGTITAAKTGAS